LLKEIGEGSVIVLDNAAFHKRSVLPALAKSCNCEVLFLPPYSPDLNPIEMKWAWLKRTLRDIIHRFDSLDDALWTAFKTS
jgi:transposase